MRNARAGIGFLTWMVLCGACSKHAPAPAHDTNTSAAPAPAAPADAPPTFINKVWRVAGPSESARGMLYVFLSTGTLVIHGPHDTPALGTWTQDGGALTMVEEGVAYPVDILALSNTEFRIRMHNPGAPTDIDFVAADGSSAAADAAPPGLGSGTE